METRFITQFELYCDDWMETRAAEYWVQDIEKRRYCSLIRPAFDFRSRKEKAEQLTRADLNDIVVDDVHYPGLKWDDCVNAEFWQEVTWLHPLIRVEEDDKANDIRGWDWMTFDVEYGMSKSDSWWSRLCNAFYDTVLAYLQFRCQDKGRSRHIGSSSQKYLLSVYTEGSLGSPTTPDGRFIPDEFPCPELSLTEWRQRMEQVGYTPTSLEPWRAFRDIERESDAMNLDAWGETGVPQAVYTEVTRADQDVQKRIEKAVEEVIPEVSTFSEFR